VVVFLFAISVHESAHAYVAWRCGDPTARMLGRVTLNPLKHIDPWGTVIIPAICIASHVPVFGWAKPTPVNSRNFKDVVKSDILTSLAGPASNMMVAVASVLLLIVIKHATSGTFGRGTAMEPIVLLLYTAMLINVLLAVFNCIPIPPLDGSHVLRHFLPESAMRAYQMIGTFALIALLFFGGPLLNALMAPFLNFFQALLARL
jgi:Zn-dependent protease